MTQELSRSTGDIPVTPAADGAALAVLRARLDTEEVERARDYLRAHDERTLAEQVALTEIPAPPFHEDARGRHLAMLMDAAGLVDVCTDGVGNVLGWYPHPGRGAAPVVLSAHLDTVFPEGTDVGVRREGGRLYGPGISDDGRGLAAILAVSRSLAHGGLRLRHPLLVVGTVGEEGVGDLRGVRHLVGPDGAARNARAFLSLDGGGHRHVVTQGVGSRRFRITVQGPGGHSWVDWGLANPLHALGHAVARLDAIGLPEGTTLSVGRAGGGTSINAIPEEAWLEMEIRSRVAGTLEVLEPQVHAAFRDALDQVNGARTQGSAPLSLDVASLGYRPGGETAPGAAVVRAAVAATRVLGREPLLAASSTDSNVPMAMGIPSVTLGAGGSAGGAHTLEEWYDNIDGPDGLVRALLTVLALDDLDP